MLLTYAVNVSKGHLIHGASPIPFASPELVLFNPYVPGSQMARHPSRGAPSPAVLVSVYVCIREIVHVWYVYIYICVCVCVCVCVCACMCMCICAYPCMTYAQVNVLRRSTTRSIGLWM
jgi:hypothetical protein